MTSEGSPKPEHHSTSLEEANLVVGLLGTSPAKRLVKGASPTQVGHAKRFGGHGAPGVELAHNVRSPEEVGQVLQEAERAGGSIVRPAAPADWGGTSGAFGDPEGYVWEVAHNPGWTITDDGSIRI